MGWYYVPVALALPALFYEGALRGSLYYVLTVPTVLGLPAGGRWGRPRSSRWPACPGPPGCGRCWGWWLPYQAFPRGGADQPGLGAGRGGGGDPQTVPNGLRGRPWPCPCPR